MLYPKEDKENRILLYAVSIELSDTSVALTISKIQVITPESVIELDILNPNPTNLVEILSLSAVLISQVKGDLTWEL